MNIGVNIKGPVTIHKDNQGAIDIAKNPKHHDRTKHIDVCHHFVRERVASNDIVVSYCPTGEMVADVLTKGLPVVKFRRFRDELGVVDVECQVGPRD